MMAIANSRVLILVSSKNRMGGSYR
jgi:hypothetical protein